MITRPIRRSGFTVADLLMTLALLALVAAAAAPAAVQQWETSNRVKCAANLRHIGQAMRQYAIDDIRAGGFPRTLYDSTKADRPQFGTPYDNDGKPGPNADANPFATPELAERNACFKPLVPFAPEANDVTAAMFHLLRQSDMTTEPFVCPSTGQKPLQFADGFGKTAYTNWTGPHALRDGLSYSFQNMYAGPKGIGNGCRWTNALPAAYILAADMNPGSDEALALTSGDLPADASQDVMRAYNSHNHFGVGQNVLHADGSVRFVASPMVGPKNDNIFAYRDAAGGGDHWPQDPGATKSAGLVGPPADAMDNVLLPTAKLLGQTARPMPTEEQIRAEDK